MNYRRRQETIRYYRNNIEAAIRQAEQADLDASFFRGEASLWTKLLNKFLQENPTAEPKNNK